jgi:hypothetical protein
LAVLSKEVRGVEASASEATVRVIVLHLAETGEPLIVGGPFYAVPVNRTDPDDRRVPDSAKMHVYFPGWADGQPSRHAWVLEDAWDIANMCDARGDSQVKPTGTTEDKQSARARADVQERED